MELRGIEPLTFSMRTRRATNCAIAPWLVSGPTEENFSRWRREIPNPLVGSGNGRGVDRDVSLVLGLASAGAEVDQPEGGAVAEAEVAGVCADRRAHSCAGIATVR